MSTDGSNGYEPRLKTLYESEVRPRLKDELRVSRPSLEDTYLELIR